MEDADGGSYEEILVGLQQHEDVLGAALVTRDGLPAMLRFGRPHDPQTLSAMSAAALAAAETALIGLDAVGVERMILQGGETNAIIEGLDNRTILLVIASQNMPLDELGAMTSKAKQELQAAHA